MKKSTPTHSLRRFLTLGVGVGALVAYANPALAQDAPDEEDGARRLNKVEVVATRREGTTVQDVPIAITAYDAQTLREADFTDLNDLEQIAPSVQISRGQSASAGSTISIRGLGTGGDDFGFEPAVGVLIDGVFRTRTGIAVGELPELSSIEVLRGPQGTLFGRNTSAGVINIQTAKPEEEFRATGTVEYGNFDALNLDATLTGSLIAGSATRLDAGYRRRDGFITDANSDTDFNNQDRFFVRLQHTMEGDNWDARIIADYAETDEDCCAAVQVGGPLDALLDGLAALAPLTGSAPTPLVGVVPTGLTDDDLRFSGAFSPNRPFQDDIQDWGVSLEYNRDLNIGKFTSITAYRQFDSTRSQDIDFSGIDRAFRDGQENNDRTFTQELRLQGLAFEDKLDWLVGAFYMNQTIDATETIRFGTQANEFTDLLAFNLAGGGQLFGSLPEAVFGQAVPLLGFTDPATGLPVVIDPMTGMPIGPVTPINTPGAIANFLPPTVAGDGNNDDLFELTTNAIGIFTHNVFNVTDNFSITAGLRYNWEDKTLDVDLNTQGVPGCAFLQGPTGQPIVEALDGFALAVCNPAIDSAFDGQRSGDRDESEFTGTLRGTYKFTPDISIFGGYSRGFKSGSFNLTRSGFASRFVGDPNDPGGLTLGPDTGNPVSELEFGNEIVNAYEVGFKSAFGDGRYTLNGTFFFQDVAGFQENVFNGTNFITVGTEVESIGVELDVGANPIDNLLIQGGFLWVQAERQEDVQIGAATLQGGVQLGNTPEFVLTAQATYTQPLTDWLEGIIHTNVRWQSAFETSSIPELDPFGNPAFATVGFRVGVQDPEGSWRLNFFAENLFDQRFNVISFGVPEQTGQFAIFPGEPRFFGGQLSVTFR